MKNVNILLKMIIAAIVVLASTSVTAVSAGTNCERTVEADVVALDQQIYYNRLGAFNPGGMMFALREDVVNETTKLSEKEGGTLQEGNVELRPDKRPRPLVLRMNIGDCLQINFQNLLNTSPVWEQPGTRTASVHVTGLHPVDNITSIGSNTGVNPGALASPGEYKTYKYHASNENTYFIYSSAATTGGEGDLGQISMGLFGAVNVEPKDAEWYRSQMTRDEITLASNGEKLPGGQPKVNYDAVFPQGHVFEGRPILKILETIDEQNKIYKIRHSDLNAIITGPDRGSLSYNQNPVYPDRDRPFREFTAIFHDESAGIQAFDIFEDPVLEFTLHSVRDSFGINYGIAGAGSEVVANRLGVGPVWNCPECKYEEFFLTSWAIGDPDILVDIPANKKDADGNIIKGPKATKALYPGDPSNVFSSYLNDRVKIRNIAAGKEHHIFHLHGHQWLYTPDSDNSSYLDSQHIGPGSGYTYEIAYDSGNRNKDAGDAIFHCHFYPHFAQGMWALWRVHDVFEEGTEIGIDGKPEPGSRAYPDGEIDAGTPIPAIVPMPGYAVAPMPQAKVEIVKEEGFGGGQIKLSPLPGSLSSDIGYPGYPFHIPGKAGHRPPKPPLDTKFDGGLPRHVIVNGTTHTITNRTDFSKELLSAKAVQLPENGTDAEKAAMDYHSQPYNDSYTPEGLPAKFLKNGMLPRPGAPFSDPCRDDSPLEPKPIGKNRLYQLAVVQLDMMLNRAGWHLPQSRILSLWQDVSSLLNKTRAPEPLVFRANTNDCVTIEHTILSPHVYEQDDFQVRTPTDVTGQHVHLVKFDLQASDGSGNGWNYEDGTFSPGEVRERINAIRAEEGNWTSDGIAGPEKKNREDLEAKAHPYFGAGPNGDWLGAQITIQRWYVDNVSNNKGQDRQLGNVFTHDHFGPSTVQQTGLSATFITEPMDSIWKDPETGKIMGARSDGGPTSWRADIITKNRSDSHREFTLHFNDFMPAYEAGGGIDVSGKPKPDPKKAINPPVRKEVGLPFVMVKSDQCPGSTPENQILPPCPEAIAVSDTGTFAVNYRNEPVPLRIRNAKNNQTAGVAGDLSYVYKSMTRSDQLLRSNVYPPLTKGVLQGDPFTPLLRVYQGDKVMIRVQVGSTEEEHFVTVNGIKWLQEPSDPNSGYRNSQFIGISEQFTFVVPNLLPRATGKFTDYLYKTDASIEGQWNGMWGLMRSYRAPMANLSTLPSNPIGGRAITNLFEFNGVCPKTAQVRQYNISAIPAKALPEEKLIYNSRSGGGVISDPTAILYVLTKDINTTSGKLNDGVPIEPLVLRANAGDCINITLSNRLPSTLPDLPGFNTLPMIIEKFNANQIKPSNIVGLHPQLVAYDVTNSDGTNAGFNPVQTALPGGKINYSWYAGTLSQSADGRLIATPVEFGAINLMPSDPIKQGGKGAIGALIIEPAGSAWDENMDEGTRTSVLVNTSDGSGFREFVVIFQDGLNLRKGADTMPPLGAVEDDPTDSEYSGQAGINYRTEPIWKRMNYDPVQDAHFTNTLDFTDVLSNSQVGEDPVTPVFRAKAGTPVRFRILNPDGHSKSVVFNIEGHSWEREPYIGNSAMIGDNPLSQWIGTQEGIGPTNHFDIVLPGAGGVFNITGDYLYRNQAPWRFDGGQWGIFRVE